MQPLYNINENSIYEIKLIMNEIDNLKTCNIRVKKLTEPIFQKLEAKNSWLYLKNAIMHIICKNDIS